MESTRILIETVYYRWRTNGSFGDYPFLGSLLATLPVTVGNAVLFVAYLQLFGTSLKSLNGYIFNSVTIHRLAAPVLIGVCIMNLDVDLFKIFPVYFQPLLSNGL